MKQRILLPAFTLLICRATIAGAEIPPSAEQVRLAVRAHASNLELSWPATIQAADGQTTQPFFELQRSTDLKSWEPLGERLRATADSAGEPLRMTLSLDQSRAFYRLLTSLPRTNLTLAAGGAEVFGYGAAFARELERIGQISAEEFATLFPSGANYVAGISWDPMTAQFWEQFNADPAVVNVDKMYGEPGYRTFDFRLNEKELDVFTNQGFVVSERLGSGSFADVLYNVWHNDLPVFISTDMILQAWHRTYDAMLEEIEETYLFNGFETLLDRMAAQLPAAWADAGGGVLSESLRDADYLLAVARSLLAGQPVPSQLNQDARVAETLADIQAEVMKPVELFGQPCRVVDFSQFKVRGHYTHSERLGRYFKCVMWLGRTDLAVAGGPFDRGCDVTMASPRELGTAVVLWHLLNRSDQSQAWQNFDRIIQVFVGWTDSMTFPQLGGVLSRAGIRSLADVPDVATLERLQADMLAGNVGVQNIRSDYFVSPLGSEQIQLPRSFLVFGQKFVPDSWGFSQTVFDSILWDNSKVSRRVPSALDTAFAILGNNQIVPELVARIEGRAEDPSRPHALRFRDGFPYQHNLAAVRAVMGAQQPEAWDSNIYMGWLAALRELSTPTTDLAFPETMRTRAWAMKTLNTQLASWTQLRHDTILYAKQSYTGGDQCFYPAGFVEPRLVFWKRLRATASQAADLIAGLQYEGSYQSESTEIPLSSIQSNQVAHLRRFSDTVGTLKTLSEKELTRECFSADEELFIRSLIQSPPVFGCGAIREYSGWFPALFYRPVHFSDPRVFQESFGVNAADQIVADVHTDVPCDICGGDLGSVLHEGIGRVNLLMILVENGADRMVFAGPVLSHYEFEVIGSPRRLNDNEWQGILNGSLPGDVESSRVEGVTPPVWTSGYLVPR